MAVDDALLQIQQLLGRRLFFLDNHLFGNRQFTAALFDGMRGMGRLWQSAGTVQSVLESGLIEKAVECGLRSLFIGFETLNAGNLLMQNKRHNLNRSYEEAIKWLHDLGVMINASFVFGLDDDDESVFERTVSWAIQQGIETSTFHILTPYPGTALHARLSEQGRITGMNWNLYDTRHAVYTPVRVSAEVLEEGYWRAYRDFYSWCSIFRGAWTKPDLSGKLRHLAYSGGWKKLEPVWDFVIRAQRVSSFKPLLEGILAGFGRNGKVSADKRSSILDPLSER